jgi:amino acid permease
MASAGVVTGMFTCLFSGCVAAFALYLLSLCAQHAPHRKSSFFAISEITFPRAAVFFDAAIAIKCFGVSIRCARSPQLGYQLSDSASALSYLIIIKGLMPNVIQSLYHDLTSEGTEPPAWALSGRLWISLFMSVLIPLAFLRRLDSLRHASFIGLFTVGKFLGFICMRK